MLSKLTVPEPLIGQEVKETIGSLKQKLDVWSTETFALRNGADDKLVRFGPFSGRALLEAGTCYLISRIDLYRILVARRVQGAPEFDPEKRVPSAIQWNGDVMPKNERKEGGLWDVNLGSEKFSRALFSKEVDALYWRPAYNQVVDVLKDEKKLKILISLKGIDPDGLLENLRGRASSLYSFLSKGVHQENLVPYDSALNPMSIRQNLRDLVEFTSTLLLLGRSFPGRSPELDAREILPVLQEIEEANYAGK